MMVTSTTLPRIPRGMVSEQIQLAGNKRANSLWGVIERGRDVAKIGKRLQKQRDPVPIDLAAKTPDKLDFVRLQQKVFDQILMGIGRAKAWIIPFHRLPGGGPENFSKEQEPEIIRVKVGERDHQTGDSTAVVPVPKVKTEIVK